MRGDAVGINSVPEDRKLVIMAQGLNMPSWAITAKLEMLDLAADVEVSSHSPGFGHHMRLWLLAWRGQDISSLLAGGHREAAAVVQALVRFLSARAYSMQIIVCLDTQRTSGYSVEVLPGKVAAILPHLYRIGPATAFVRCLSVERHLGF